MSKETSNANVKFLQDEVLNTVDRCRAECENLTIVETLGVLEHVKFSLWQATFGKEKESE
jgi:hypothetical protein